MKKALFLILILFVCLSVFAADSTISFNLHRYALVIGNSKYDEGALANPANDAKLISDKLTECGFEVSYYLNLTDINMKDAIASFVKTVNSDKDATALVYYAGHGLEIDGVNYLIPINNGKINSEADAKIYGYSVDELLGLLNDVKEQIIILDACRNNPFKLSGDRAVSTKGGLGALKEAKKGVVMSYLFAAQSGQTAKDGEGSNSVFSAILAEEIEKGNMPLYEVFNNVATRVREFTKGEQVPLSSTTGSGFVFQSEELANSVLARYNEQLKAAEAELAKYSNKTSTNAGDVAAAAAAEAKLAIAKAEQEAAAKRAETVRKDAEAKALDAELAEARTKELKEQIQAMKIAAENAATLARQRQVDTSSAVSIVNEVLMLKGSLDSILNERDAKKAEKAKELDAVYASKCAAIDSRPYSAAEKDSDGNPTSRALSMRNQQKQKERDALDLELENYMKELAKSTADQEASLKQSLAQYSKDLKGKVFTISSVLGTLNCSLDSFDGEIGGWPIRFSSNIDDYFSYKATLMYEDVTGLKNNSDSDDFDAYWEYIENVDMYDSLFRTDVPIINVELSFMIDCSEDGSSIVMAPSSATVTRSDNGKQIAKYDAKKLDNLFSPVGASDDDRVPMPKIKSTYVSDTTRMIELVCDNKDAVIYYTTNGSEPSRMDTRYTEPFKANAGTVIRAKAYSKNLNVSWMSSYEVQKTVADPVLEAKYFDSGKYYVTIKSSTSGSTVVYTSDGSAINSASATFSGTQGFAPGTVLRFKATKSGYADSATLTYTVPSADSKTTAPSITSAFHDERSKTITLSNDLGCTVFYYTLDGSLPTTASLKYERPFDCDFNTQINAIAVCPGYATSAVSSYVVPPFGAKVANPVILADYYDSGQYYMNLTCSTPGAIVTCSESDATPTELSYVLLPEYSYGLESGATYKFRAFCDGYYPSDIITFTVPDSSSTAKAPLIGSDYNDGKTRIVSIEEVTPVSKIYYTTNGSEPTMASKVYSGPFEASPNSVIKAVAAAPGYGLSSVASYTVPSATMQKVATPVLSYSNGYLTATSSTSGVTFRYVRYYLDSYGYYKDSDGNKYSQPPVPTESSNTISKNISVSSGYYYSIRAYRSGYEPSDVVTWLSPSSSYYDDSGSTVKTPVIRSEYHDSTSRSVSLTCSTPYSEIRYTTDGSTPKKTSKLYTGPFVAENGSTVKAVAYCIGYNDSAVRSYVVPRPGQKVSTPILSLNSSGSYLSATSSTPGVTFRYEVYYYDSYYQQYRSYDYYSYDDNGYSQPPVPTENSKSISKNIEVSSGYYYSIRAFCNGYEPSDVVTWLSPKSSYYDDSDSTVKTPVIKSEYRDSTSRSVSLSCSTPYSEIRYTTDGSTPIESSKLYTEPFAVENGTVVKAVAYCIGYSKSSVKEYQVPTPGQKASAPVLTYEGDYYDSYIYLTSSTPGATFRYEYGSRMPNNPTENSSKVESYYDEETRTTRYYIDVYSGYYYKIQAFCNGFEPSDIITWYSPSSSYYSSSNNVASQPTAKSSQVKGTNNYSVTLSSSTYYPIIRYTTDGSTPIESSTLYTGPFEVPKGTVVKAITYCPGYEKSTMLTYTVK